MTESKGRAADRAGWTQRAEAVALGVRRRVLVHTLRTGGGYLSQACSSAELLSVLYTRVLRLGESCGPMNPPPFGGVPGPGAPSMRGGAYNGPRLADTDRFVFSPVHYSLVLYSVLIEMGRLAPQALETFNQDGSTVEMIGAEHSPGIEVTAGSLAQALSVASGMAMARKRKAERGRVWVFMTDGEFQEGQTWEAVAAAAFHRLSGLRVLVDLNGQQCDGAMGEVMNIEPLSERLRAFGADVVEVDGHLIPAIAEACERPATDRPLFVIARTDPCRGLAVLRSRAPNLHYVRFKSQAEREAFEATLAELGGPS